jgi:hypothetical protein
MKNLNQLIANLQAKIEDYQRSGDIVRSTLLAQQLAHEFPESGMTEAEVADLIVREAARVGVPLEVGE